MMAKYRKKPVVIEAWKFISGLDIPPSWFTDDENNSIGMDSFGPFISIKTLEGTMLGRSGDWIIRGVQGEIYPCKPNIFAETYEPAD